MSPLPMDIWPSIKWRTDPCNGPEMAMSLGFTGALLRIQSSGAVSLQSEYVPLVHWIRIVTRGYPLRYQAKGATPSSQYRKSARTSYLIESTVREHEL
jgi:hypothetical protein